MDTNIYRYHNVENYINQTACIHVYMISFYLLYYHCNPKHEGHFTMKYCHLNNNKALSHIITFETCYPVSMLYYKVKP